MSRFDDGIRRAYADRGPSGGELVQAGAPAGRRMQRSPWELHDDDVAPLGSGAPVAPADPVEPYALARPERQLFELVATDPEPRPRRSRWWLRAAIAAALIAAAAVFGAGYVVGLGGTPETATLVGTVGANDVVVAAKYGGRLQTLLVDEGDTVARGDVIGLLDREEIEAERRDHLARIGQLEALLAQTRELVRLEGERVAGRTAVARAALQAAISDRERTEAELAQARNDATRAAALVEAGVMPRQDAERAQTALRSAEARLNASLEHVRSAQAEVTLAEANERQVRVAGGDEEQARAQLAQAHAQLAQVDARLADAEIRAPLGGMVSLRVAREGEVVAAGAPIVTIVDLDDVWVRGEVEEGAVGQMAVGQTLDVRLASGEIVRGRITFISPEAEFATQRDVSRVKRDVRTFGFKVALPNPDRRIHPGMTAYIAFPGAVANTR